MAKTPDFLYNFPLSKPLILWIPKMAGEVRLDVAKSPLMAMPPVNFSASRHWVWVVAKKAKQSTQHLEILLGTFI